MRLRKLIARLTILIQTSKYSDNKDVVTKPGSIASAVLLESWYVYQAAEANGHDFAALSYRSKHAQESQHGSSAVRNRGAEFSQSPFEAIETVVVISIRLKQTWNKNKRFQSYKFDETTKLKKLANWTERFSRVLQPNRVKIRRLIYLRSTEFYSPQFAAETWWTKRMSAWLKAA